ncbi:MAG: hypothetical protein PHU25_15630 [Deltaproteobacteria bacterium]|nr:hypothetical protein [Deltaproteobacteria bacterium]
MKMMSNGESKQCFDFFAASLNGEPPEEIHIATPNGHGRTHTLREGLEEDFGFGWNTETTYGLYRGRAESLLMLAGRSDIDEEAVQALLASVIVFVASGLEALVRTAAKVRQVDDFIRLVEDVAGYVPIDPRDHAPLGRLFQIRHAIVHNGWRVTKKIQGQVSGRMPRGKELHFGYDEVRAVVEAADRFAKCVAPCFPNLTQDL